MKGRLSEKDISAIAIFEKVTGGRVVDYLETEDTLFFVVGGRTPLSKIVGKGGANTKRLQAKFGKQIRVYRIAGRAEQYARNLTGVRVRSSTLVKKSDGSSLVKIAVAREDKPLVLGRNKGNLAAIKQLLRRQFEGADLKVE